MTTPCRIGMRQINDLRNFARKRGESSSAFFCCEVAKTSSARRLRGGRGMTSDKWSHATRKRELGIFSRYTVVGKGSTNLEDVKKRVHFREISRNHWWNSHLRVASPSSHPTVAMDGRTGLRCDFLTRPTTWEYSLYTWVASTTPLVKPSRPLGHAPTLLGQRECQETNLIGLP